MPDLSTNAANRFITWLMTTSSVTRPPTIRAALFTSPTAEVSGGGYSRQNITFSNGSNRGTSNTNTVNFVCSGTNWGNITHIALFDAQSGGDMLWQDPVIGGAKLIENGDTLVIQAGSITISVN